VLASDDLPEGWRERVDSLRVFVNGDEITRLALVSPEVGMRFAPFGMGGRRKLLGDFFTDRKVPVALRAGVPLVVDGESGEIVWVCGYGVAEAAAIDAQTKRVLALEWVQDDAGER
jgi:tRNA(Ile)-lysidine synthetase-like protein